jgi:phage tail sheath protein FI
MQQNFTETDQSYLYAGNVNPIVVFPGEGTFLMGNKTSYNGTGSLSKINTASLVSYLKKELLASTQKYLFEVNDALTRQRVVSTVTPILQSVLSGNGITNYRIVCDETNNTSEILAQNKLVLDVYIQPTPTAETLVITIINTNTSEAFSG